MATLITKVSLSGYIRGTKHQSHHSYPKGMDTQEYIDLLYNHRRAFEAPYEYTVTMIEPE